MADISSELNRILQSNLSQQISSSLYANQMQIKNLQDTLSAKNQQVHMLNQKLKQQLNFINTVIKKNSVLERRIAQICLFTGKLIKQINEQRNIQAQIIQHETNKMKAFCQQKVAETFSEICKKTLSILSQKDIEIRAIQQAQFQRQKLFYNIKTAQKSVETDFISHPIFVQKQAQAGNFDIQYKKYCQKISLLKEQKQIVQQKLKESQMQIEYLEQRNRKLQNESIYYKNLYSQVQDHSFSEYIQNKREHILHVIGQIYSNQFQFQQDRYHGQTIRGLKFGRGVCHYANGLTYDGYFVNDQRSGMGILKIEEQEIYRGYWKNDKFQGKGILKILRRWKQCNFCGVFINGIQSGPGTLNFSNGKKIKAKWQGQKIVGKSILILIDGKTRSGKLINDFSFKTQDGQVIDVDI